MEVLTDPLSNGTTLRALAEVFVLGVVSGVIGCWVVLFRLSYSAESLAHGLFPGLVLAALAGIPLLIGGAAGIIVAAALIVAAGRLGGESADTATAVVVTTLFGAGVLLALSPDSPPGIQHLLFGNLLGVSLQNIAAAAAVAIAVLAVLWLLHARLLAVGFDGGAGQRVGLSVARLNLLLLALVAVTILIAVQGLGTLLVAAILVGPAAAARQLTGRIGPMMAVSVAVALASGLIGIYASYHLRTAAGASVVVAILALFVLAAVAGSVGPRLRPLRD